MGELYKGSRTVRKGRSPSLWLVGLGLIGCLFFLIGFNYAGRPGTETGKTETAREPDMPISGFVIPHHDLVKEYRRQFLTKLKGALGSAIPETLVLVSPNHASSGNGSIQTSLEPWFTSKGTLEVNSTVARAVLAAGAVENNAGLRSEDGIRYIIGDLADTFPGVAVVPITVKDDVSIESLKQLNGALTSACPSCLMVSSVDFSHYQPYVLADLHDDLTIRLLQKRDANALVSKAEVDSPPTLALLTLWAESRGTQRLAVERHTNSGRMSEDPDSETTSHVFAWYEKGEEVRPEAEVSFLMGGDMMFGRMIAHTFPGTKLATVGSQLGNRLFHGSDVSIVNLEGPVSATPVPDNIQPNNLTFNFPPETIDALTYLQADAVSLANNHTSNAGSKGLENTRSMLAEAKIAAIGGPSDKDVVQVGSFAGEGLTLKVIGVHLLSTQPDLADMIKRLKEDPNNRVVVLPHWGNEYQQTHHPSQERLAHQWIDAGADAVIGSHPHVIQDTEVYGGKPIVYSMGNLLFDQTFSTETQQGMLIGGKFTATGVELFALPNGMKKYQPLLIRGDEKKNLLTRLYKGFGYDGGDSRTWKLVLP